MTGQPFHPDVRSTWYQGTAYPEQLALAGRFGKAWRATLPPIGQRRTKDQDATVALWFVHVPKRHPFWDHWALTLIHLRPIDGVRPPLIRTPGATHEVLFFALNPETALPPLDMTTWASGYAMPFLTPIDLAAQFAVADDAAADQVLESAVHTIAHLGMSPDSDFRIWWTSALEQTAAHLNAGHHGVPRA